jgi:hypothetical protein
LAWINSAKSWVKHSNYPRNQEFCGYSQTFPHILPHCDLKFLKLMLCNKTQIRKWDNINFGLQITDPTVKIIEKYKELTIGVGSKVIPVR